MWFAPLFKIFLASLQICHFRWRNDALYELPFRVFLTLSFYFDFSILLCLVEMQLWNATMHSSNFVLFQFVLYNCALLYKNIN